MKASPAYYRIAEKDMVQIETERTMIATSSPATSKRLNGRRTKQGLLGNKFQVKSPLHVTFVLELLQV